MNPNEKPSTALTLRSELEGPKFRAAIAQLLPKILTPERFVRVAILAMTRTPKLALCDRKSFFNSLLTLSQLGLEPDGRRAHLIPFENKRRKTVECQLIVDYKGLAELILRSGEVTALHADVVRENDEFEHDRGIVTRHSYKLAAPRGDVIGAYATAKTRLGAEMAKVMTLEEILSVRDNSQGFQSFKKGFSQSNPWDSDFAEMAKKTPFRQLSKWLPLSPEAKAAIDNTDDDAPAVTPSKADGSPVFDLGPDDVQTVTDPVPEPAPAPSAPIVESKPPTESPQSRLASLVTGAGFTFDDWAEWAGKRLAEKYGKELSNVDSFETVPDSLADRCIAGAKFMLAEIGGAK